MSAQLKLKPRINSEYRGEAALLLPAWRGKFTASAATSNINLVTLVEEEHVSSCIIHGAAARPRQPETRPTKNSQDPATFLFHRPP